MVEISCTCFVYTCLKDKSLKEKKNPPVSASQASVGLVAHEATSFSYGLLLGTFAYFSHPLPKDTCDAFTVPGLLPKSFFWGVSRIKSFFFNLRFFL